MRPIRLTMQAFGSYGNKAEIDFTVPLQNLFLISGNTGSGKTTIFDAIVFALYGEASSGNNKKNGLELCSQYAGNNIEPFVELVFSETKSNATEIYTVKRIPKFQRRKKNGELTKPKNESVILTLPDNSDYIGNLREINAKLEEITGLSKSQFMQVAMIAQGEFMEMLRASSENKKEIFRKLFNTGIYQKIVDETGYRLKIQENARAQMESDCKSEIRRVIIPDVFSDAEHLRLLQKRIVEEKNITSEDLRNFLEGMGALCHLLEMELDDQTLRFDRARQHRDQCADAYNRGLSLKKLFDQADEAKRIFESCQNDVAKMTEMEKTMMDIKAAYEIKNQYIRLNDQKYIVDDSKERLCKAKKRYPKLKEKVKYYEKEQKKTAEERERALRDYSRIEQQVSEGLNQLKKIEEQENTILYLQSIVQKLEMKEHKASCTLEDFENEEREKRSKLALYAELSAKQERNEHALQTLDEIAHQYEAVIDMAESLKRDKMTAETEADLYLIEKQNYQTLDESYKQKYEMFMDAQAGYIARERLIKGRPCPVCGSYDHPSPRQLSDVHKELTREGLDLLRMQRDQAQQRMTDASANASAAAQKYSTRNEQYTAMVESLLNRMKDKRADISTEQALIYMKKLLVESREKLLAQKRENEVKEQERNDLMNWLEKVDEKKLKMKESLEEAVTEHRMKRTELDNCKAVLLSLSENKPFSSEKEAKACLKEAAEKKNKAIWQDQQNSDLMQRARQEADGEAALISNFEENLPTIEEEMISRKKAYDDICELKDMSENVWMTLTTNYNLSDTDEMQTQIENYRKKKDEAINLMAYTKKNIGDEERPDLDMLMLEKNKAEDQYVKFQNALTAGRDIYKSSEQIYKALQPMEKELLKIIDSSVRINRLYQRLAGKESHYRMGIETYVQRYYMEQILNAANRRFREMSAGQFELRMYDIEQAGEGKNRGLDLQVYSTVTNTLRDVKTLSGGESFMAALSMALGMADQIQANTSGMQLDMMFIDEGFGSLDEHARNQAVRVLQKMAGGDKLIGIISHVTELKQVMEDQLIVTKDDEGSHVRWL